MLLFLTTASAADVFPGMGQISAVPQEGHVTVEVGAALAEGGLYDSTRLGTLSAAWDPSSRVRLGALARTHTYETCGWFGGNCQDRSRTDVVGVAGFAVIDHPETRLLLDVQAGTSLGGGFAFWTTTHSRLLSFDASWHPGIRTESLDGEYLDITVPTLAPEIGLTLSPDGDHHHIRLGLTGLNANLGYRVEIGPIGVELQGGYGIWTGGHARAGVSASF